MNIKLNFFKELIKNHKTLGAVTPSSRFLAKRVLKKINFNDSSVIVEFGAGNGAITRHILKKLHPKSMLICFEINDTLYNELLKIKHPQLIVLKVSAEKIEEELQRLSILKIDFIISGLPLSILPKKTSKVILKKAYKVLTIKGLFVQYQYSLMSYKNLKGLFGKGVSLDFEPLNVPPAVIYFCKK